MTEPVEPLGHLYAARVSRFDASAIREICKLCTRPEVISMAGGWPHPDTFPADDVLKALTKVLTENPGPVLQYGTTEGLPVLREALADWVRNFDGTPLDPDDIVLTHGSQQGMDLAARTLLNPGDVAVVGLPTYFGGTGAWKSQDAEIVGVRCDDDGLDTDALEQTLVRLQDDGKIAKLVYVIPNFDNPMGATLPLERRMKLLKLASEYDFVIVEDDPYGTLRYEGERIPSIQHFDREHRVVHIHSFSKILCPGFRLAMVSGEPGLIRKMVVTKQYVDCVTNTPAQFVALELLNSGAIDRRIEANRTYYRQQRDLLLQALDRHFPKAVRWNRPRGGFFIFVHLPEWLDGTQLLRECVEQNVAFVAGAPFFCDGSGHNTMRLSFSQIDPDTIDRAVATVASIMKQRIAEQS